MVPSCDNCGLPLDLEGEGYVQHWLTADGGSPYPDPATDRRLGFVLLHPSCPVPCDLVDAEGNPVGIDER